MTISLTTDYGVMETALVDWLKTYGGVGEVIWKDQDAPRPAKPYGALLVISDGRTFGVPEVRESFDVPTQAIQRQSSEPVEMTMQVEIYTEPAMTAGQSEARHLLQGAINALAHEPVRDALRAAKIGIINHTPVANLDEQLGDRWERRAQTDLTLLYSGESFDDGGAGSGDWVETAQVPTEDNGNADWSE